MLMFTRMKGFKRTAKRDRANRVVVHSNGRHLMTLERTTDPVLREHFGYDVPEYRVIGYDPSRLIEGGVEKIQGRVWVDADIPRPRSACVQSWDLLGNLFDALKPLIKD